MIIVSNSVECTERTGAELAKLLEKSNKNYCVAMYGDLGAGKTAFVRGMASVLSPGSRVKSPTYTLVNEYRKGNRPLFHFDLYRIDNTDELDNIGFEEYLYKGNCIIEWSEKLGDLVPADAVKIVINKQSENERIITIDNFNEEEL